MAYRHVAIGILQAEQGNKVLLSRRTNWQKQAGLWEFPGGKLQPGEEAWCALQRELYEELGIRIHHATPLIKFKYRYTAQYKVLLDVWRVHRWSGLPLGRQGQGIRWVETAALQHYSFPSANRFIIKALHLPSLYLISPASLHSNEQKTYMLDKIEHLLKLGLRFFQLRYPENDALAYHVLVLQLARLFRRYHAKLMLNTSPQLIQKYPAVAGLHLTSSRLMQLTERPLDDSYWVAASCHNQSELEQAEKIGVDFVTLSPVAITKSHPQAPPLGWEKFRDLVDRTHLPVYALGGMCADKIDHAQQHGAQGLAVIRGIWEASMADLGAANWQW